MIPENFCINRETFTVPLKNGFRTFRIREIVALESRESGTYIKSIHPDDCTVCEVSLAVFAEAFAPEGFFRIHNICVVNTFYVNRFDRTCDKQLFMCDGTSYRISRNNIRDFEEVMLERYRNLTGRVTIRGAKHTGFVSNPTIRGILAHPLWIALYIWRIIYDIAPIESYLS